MPRPTTHRPITEPLRKATFRALFMPPSSAAHAVLTLPLVATCMPKKPASTENAAPQTYRIAVTQLIPSPRMMKRAITTMTIVLYSLFRNAIAPSWINPAISVMRSLPVDCFPIQLASTYATHRATMPTTGAIHTNPFILKFLLGIYVIKSF